MREESSLLKRTAIQVLVFTTIFTTLIFGIIYFKLIDDMKEDRYQTLISQTQSRAEYVTYNVQNISSMLDEYIIQANDALRDTEGKADNERLRELDDIVKSMSERAAITDAYILLQSDSGPYGIHYRDGEAKKLPYESNKFYYDCYNNAISHNAGSRDKVQYGYWDEIALEKDGKSIFAYSYPLTGDNGKVYGIIGVGKCDENDIIGFSNQEVEGGKGRAYMLAKKIQDNAYVVGFIGGEAFDKEMFRGTMVTLNGSPYGTLFYIVNDGGLEFGKVCVQAGGMSLYKNGVPDNANEWVLLGVERESDLLKVYTNAVALIGILWLLSIAIIFALIMGSMMVRLKPVLNVFRQIYEADFNKILVLKKTGIEEVDSISEKVMSLNKRILRTYLKSSRVIETAGMDMVTFEYREKENLVVVGKGFFKMLCIPGRTETGKFDDATEFVKKSPWLLQEGQTEATDDIEVRDLNANTRYLSIKQYREEGIVFGIITDKTEKILNEKRRIFELEYDGFTGLYNRNIFEEKTEEIIKSGLAKYACLAYWDMDNLRFLNENYGKKVGDEYIKNFANCLKLFWEGNIISCRNASDEFISFIYGDSREDCMDVVNNLWNKANNTQMLLPEGKPCQLRATMGYAWFPGDADKLEMLIRCADYAMNTAKKNRKGTMCEFASIDNIHYEQSSGEIAELISNSNIYFDYQPVVSSKDGNVYGYEMLMRTDMKEFDGPKKIIDVAKNHSRLYEVENMTLVSGLNDYSRLLENKDINADTKIFINTVPSVKISMELESIIEKAYFSLLPNVIFEITDGEKVSSNIIGHKLDMVRQWGGRIALTSYANNDNLEFIKGNNPYVIELDMDLVRNINTESHKKETVRGIVEFAREKDMLLLAKGVESREEMMTLIELGVDLLQGYYLARPASKPSELASDLKAEIRWMHKKSIE